MNVGSTWEFDLRTRTWVISNTATSGLRSGWVARPDLLVYDEASERVLAFGSGTVAAYDATAGEWQVVESDGDVDGHWAAKAYDPLNGRVVAFLPGKMIPTEDPRAFRWPCCSDHVVAFDLRTSTWIDLFDPSP